MQTTLEFAKMRENTQQYGQKYAPNVETLAAGKTLTITSPTLQWLDPGGSGRIIVLPAEALSTGLVLIIVNAADADESLTVNDDAAALVQVVGENEIGTFYCDGTEWLGSVAHATVAGSVKRADLEADIIDGSKLEDNAVDSEHYTDGSIDTVHIGNAQITHLLTDLSDSIKLVHVAHDDASPVELLASDGVNTRTVAIIVSMTEDMAGAPDFDIGETDTVNRFLDDLGAGAILTGECLIAVGTLTSTKALICTIADAGSAGEMDIIVIVGA